MSEHVGIEVTSALNRKSSQERPKTYCNFLIKDCAVLEDFFFFLGGGGGVISVE